MRNVSETGGVTPQMCMRATLSAVTTRRDYWETCLKAWRRDSFLSFVVILMTLVLSLLLACISWQALSAPFRWTVLDQGGGPGARDRPGIGFDPVRKLSTTLGAH